MRTTITLEPEVAALVRRAMAERQTTFKQTINQAVREALEPFVPQPFHTPVHHGRINGDLTKALRIAGELEDAENIQKMGLEA